MDKKDKKKLDGDIQINGLSDESVTTCIDRYFDKEKVNQLTTTSEGTALESMKRQVFIEKTKKRGIYGLLKIPILLLMLCVLYVETGDLPKRRTDIMWEVIQIYIKRAKEEGFEFGDPDVLLRHLGELSYDASQRESHQLMIKKVWQEMFTLTYFNNKLKFVKSKK